MKKTIKQMLRESLMGEEQIKGLEIEAYHGSPKEFQSFNDEFVGGENATDQEGPGIYFTTNYEEALMYANGGYVYKVLLKPSLMFGQDEGKRTIKASLLSKLVRMANDWKSNAQNFDYNPSVGLRIFVEGAFEYNDSDKDTLLQVWIEFYKYDSVNYVRNCVKAGVDGIMVNRYNKEGNHVIIYNPSVINLIEKIKV